MSLDRFRASYPASPPRIELRHPHEGVAMTPDDGLFAIGARPTEASIAEGFPRDDTAASRRHLWVIGEQAEPCALEDCPVAEGGALHAPSRDQVSCIMQVSSEKRSSPREWLLIAFGGDVTDGPRAKPIERCERIVRTTDLRSLQVRRRRGRAGAPEIGRGSRSILTKYLIPPRTHQLRPCAACGAGACPGRAAIGFAVGWNGMNVAAGARCRPRGFPRSTFGHRP